MRSRTFPPAFILASTLCVCFIPIADGQTLTLSNHEVAAQWHVVDGKLRPIGLTDSATGRSLTLAGPDFSIRLQDGSTVRSDELKLAGSPIIESVARAPRSSKLSDRLGGTQLKAAFVDSMQRFKATLTAVLRSGSRYLREEVTITAIGSDLPVNRIQLIDLTTPGIAVDGTVQGSPLASNDLFAGVENPLSRSRVVDGHGLSWMDRKLPIRAGQSATESSVIGFADEGQLRRDFLAYLERERAHPYRTFLHYNSWYDLGWSREYNADECVHEINAFGAELVKKRGVKMSSFLFDDGWDDYSTVWDFHKGFPQGFYPLKQAAADIGAAPGIWLSPWGGYGDAREARLKTGKAKGYEIDSEGYALSGPKYFERFRTVTLDLVRKYGINQFKFDGTGSPDKQYPGSSFGSDFEAAITLIKDLRAAKPDLFVNLTTGTWPSPFWTRYADSIWRGSADHSFAGVGPNRERWITYRDGHTYGGVVRRGPLYPINSLMLHGIIYARYADRLNTDPTNDFRNEVRSYFATGTQLQEMYITPSLLTPQNWDDLAEAANWSRANADILVDTHWIGGDPLKLQVYGWASWKGGKAILALRNPSDQPQKITIDVQKAFELPVGAPWSYVMHSPWKEDKRQPSIRMDAHAPTEISLKPFEVVVLNGRPDRY